MDAIALIIPQLNEDNTVSHNSINLKNKYEFNIVAEILAKEMGFDFNRGRIDSTVHPFCGGHPQDVTHLLAALCKRSGETSVLGLAWLQN